MSWSQKHASNARAYTCRVLELLDEGMLDKDNLIQDLLGWMSEDDVKQFCERNLQDLFEDEDDEERDPMDDFNYVGSRHHY